MLAALLFLVPQGPAPQPSESDWTYIDRCVDMPSWGWDVMRGRSHYLPPELHPDLDGDGWEDLAYPFVVRDEWHGDGMGGSIKIHSSRTNELLARLRGPGEVARLGDGTWLVSNRARAERRETLAAAPVWALDLGQSSGRFRVVGDADADGVEDIAFVERRDFSSSNRVELFSGAQGTSLWISTATPAFVPCTPAVPAGDVDGDRHPDLVLIAQADTNQLTRLQFLSGKDGVLLHAESIPDRRASTLLGIGDMDGDGLEDLILTGEHAHTFLSASSTWNRLDRENETVWWSAPPSTAASSGDLDGDGLADLVLGQVDAEGHRSVVLFGLHGHRTLRELTPGEPAWDDVRYAAVLPLDQRAFDLVLIRDARSDLELTERIVGRR